MGVEFIMEDNTLQQRVEELKQQFEACVTEENTLAQVYNQKIEELRTEGQRRIDEVTMRKERIRGAYTELIYMLHPELKQQNTDSSIAEQSVEPDSDTVSVSTEPINMEDADTVSVSVGAPEQTENEAPATTLTPEELQKLADTMNKANENKTSNKESKQVSKSSVKEEDIPEYLKDEYKK